MAASVLNSPRAVEVSVYVLRVFVRMREAMSSDRELARRLDVLERKYASHDVRIRGIFDAIRSLMQPYRWPYRSNESRPGSCRSGSFPFRVEFPEQQLLAGENQQAGGSILTSRDGSILESVKGKWAARKSKG